MSEPTLRLLAGGPDAAAKDSSDEDDTAELSKKVDSTAESHDTYINTIDSAEPGTYSKCSRIEKL